MTTPVKPIPAKVHNDEVTFYLGGALKECALAFKQLAATLSLEWRTHGDIPHTKRGPSWGPSWGTPLYTRARLFF